MPIEDEDPHNYEDYLDGQPAATEALNEVASVDANTVKLGLFDLIEVNGKSGAEPEYRRNLFQQDVVKAFVAVHAGILRHDSGAGQWLFFTGSQWALVKVQQVVAPFLKRLSVGFDERQQREMLSVNYAEAVERGARSAPGINTSPSQWDANLDVIGTPGGIVDLKTGNVYPMSADAMIRKTTSVGLPYVPPEVADILAKEGRAIELDGPTWRWFLKDRFGDDDTIAFVQRYFGYCLTGHIHEQRLLYLYGGGGNGKNLLAETVAYVMGDYARNAAIETVTEQRGSRHMSELAVLNGARFVRVSEPPSGFEWNEKRLKTITGDEKITANLKHKDEMSSSSRSRSRSWQTRRRRLRILASPCSAGSSPSSSRRSSAPTFVWPRSCARKARRSCNGSSKALSIGTGAACACQRGSSPTPGLSCGRARPSTSGTPSAAPASQAVRPVIVSFGPTGSLGQSSMATTSALECGCRTS
jgi:hypothetical protein